MKRNHMKAANVRTMTAVIKKISVIFLLGLLYYGWIRLTAISIPCPFRVVTGRLCPGCGVTGLCIHLIHLRFKMAFLSNPFLFVTGPALALEIVYALCKSEQKQMLPTWNQRLVYVYMIALIAFGIIRNIV